MMEWCGFELKIVYFVCSIIFFWIVYNFLTVNHDFWQNRGVVYEKPVPFFGNMLDVVVGREHCYSDQIRCYGRFGNERYYGRFNFRSPVLVIRDPELIVDVLVKDFKHFYNRSLNFNPKVDKLSLHLVNLRDEGWKSLRSKLAPVFSTLNLKPIEKSLSDCCRSLSENLKAFSSTSEPFQAKDIVSDFTMQVIEMCVFGLDSPNRELRETGKAILFPNLKGRIRYAIRLVFPRLLSWLRWKAVTSRIEGFFFRLVQDAEAAERGNEITTPNLLQLLIRLKNGEKIKENTRGQDNLIVDDSVVASNLMVFFLAGYETTATSLAFCLYELANDFSVQDRLRQEVLSKTDQVNLSYEVVNQMDYLQQVIAETLRKYPPVDSLARVCTRDWKVPGSNLVISKGTHISVPVYSLHHDPLYFPQPEQFQPERFSRENRANMVKGTYLPFGDGPRICIARKLAEMEMKFVLASLMIKFKFSINGKTQMPLKFRGGFQRIPILVPEGGVWINAEPV